MNRLQQQTTLITGGNSGIGYAAAKLFKEEGASVIITGRNPGAITSAAANLNVAGYVANQSRLADLDTLAENIKADFGRLDAVFLNAGIATFSPFELAGEEHYDSIMDTNVKGVFFTLQKLLPLLRNGGSIIFNTSINASVGMPGSGVYAASKAALIALSRVLASELAPRNIRVNCISPGPVETPVYEKLGMTNEQAEAFSKVLSEKILLKRFAQADEIAKLAIFLASGESSFITGAEIVIDGGITTNPVML